MHVKPMKTMTPIQSQRVFSFAPMSLAICAERAKTIPTVANTARFRVRVSAIRCWMREGAPGESVMSLLIGSKPSRESPAQPKRSVPSRARR